MTNQGRSQSDDRQSTTTGEAGVVADKQVDDSALKMFASTLAHDIRTPLLVAHSNLQLMDADPDRVERVQNALEDIELIADEIYTLAEKGGSIGPLVETSLAVAASQAWEQVPTSMARLQIESNCTILADKIALERILVNIFTNAVEHGIPDDAPRTRHRNLEYSSSPGEVVSTALSHCEDPDYADLVVTIGALENGFFVEDDGQGFPQSFDESSIEPGDSGSDDSASLGLDLVKWFATAQGWSVTATCGCDGGARFEFTDVKKNA